MVEPQPSKLAMPVRSRSPARFARGFPGSNLRFGSIHFFAHASQRISHPLWSPALNFRLRLKSRARTISIGLAPSVTKRQSSIALAASRARTYGSAVSISLLMLRKELVTRSSNLRLRLKSRARTTSIGSAPSVAKRQPSIASACARSRTYELVMGYCCKSE